MSEALFSAASLIVINNMFEIVHLSYMIRGYLLFLLQELKLTMSVLVVILTTSHIITINNDNQ